MLDRRSDARVDLEVPCKVWHPRAMRFLPGTTHDLSRNGASVTLRSGLPLQPGERIRVGLPAQAGAIVRSGSDLIEGTVVRTSTSEGRVLVAISFDGAAQDQAEAAARRA